MFFFTVVFIFSQTLLATPSNEKVVLQGRIIDSTGVAVTDSNVTFDIKIYSPTTGAPGTHCLLYEETQLLDMSNSGGTFALQIGTGTRIGSGPTLRETFTNASVASFAALTCSTGSSYAPGAIDDRTIEMTVSFASQNLALQPIPVKAVPYAFQANQIGGYGINNLVRLNGAGSATNLDVDQFNYLTGFFHDNGTNGVYTDDYLDAQNLVIKNVASPVLGTDAVNKNYVDTAVAGASGSLPTLTSAKIWVGNSSNAAAAVSMSGDASIDNTGKVTVTGLQSKPVTVSGLASKDTLMYNGSAWVNLNMPTCSGSQYLTFNGTAYTCVTTSNSPVGAALNSAQIWVGNSGNVAAPVSMSGDGSIDNTGKLTNTGLQGKPVDSTAPISNQVLQYNGSSWVPSTLSLNFLSPTLNDAKIWVGNSGNTATPVSVSGDASIIDTGAMTVTGLRGVTVSATAPISNQVLQYNGSSWVPTSLSATLPSLNSAQIWIGNTSNVPVGVTPSGDASITSAGVITNTGLQGTAVAVSSLSTNQVLQYNGSKWVNASIVTAVTGSALNDGKFWLGNAGNTAQPVSMTGDVTMDDAGVTTYNGTVPVTKGGTGATTYNLGEVPVYNGTKLAGTSCSLGQTLVWTASGFACGMQSASGSSLAAGDIWVGNSSGIAVAVAPSGDASISNTGAITNTGIQGTAVAVSSLSANQVLQYNGSKWVNATISTSPTGQALNSAQIWVGNGSNLAAPVSVTGDVSLTNAGAMTTTGIQGTAVAVSSLSANQVLQYNGSKWVNASLSATLPSLTDTQIWVGNSSNVPMPVSASGDISLADTGAFTVNKIQNSTVTISSPSANQILQYNGSAWLNVTPTYQSSTLTDAKMWVGNSGNVATAVSAGGDVSMADTGSFTVNKIQNSTVTISSPSANQILQYNGSAWLNVTPNYETTTLASNNVWLGNASNVATAASIPTCAANYYLTFNGSAFSCSLDAGSTGSVTSITATAPLAASGSTGNVTLSMDLAAGHVYVGNASNLATDVAMSGDASISNTGAVTNTGIQGTPVAIASLATNQLLQYNGSKWVNITPSYQSNSLTSGNIWIGNGSNVAVGVTPSGDASITSAGVITNTGLQGTAVAVSSLSTNQVLQYNGSKWVNASIVTAVTGSSLTDGKFWLGNAGNTAQVVSMSGDATMDDTGALTLATVPVTKGGTGATTYNLGEVPVYNGTKLAGTSCSLGQTLVWTASGFACGMQSASGSSLAAGDIWVGNSSGIAVAVAPSGDASISNTGAITNTGIQGTAVAVSSLSANQVLQYNGSKWVNATLSATLPSLADAKIWVGNGSSVATAVTPSGDVSLADTGALTVNKIQNSTVTISSPSANQILQYNGSAWLNTTPSYQSSTLTDAKMWVGNSSNVATAVSAGGDVSMADTGSFTVNKIQNSTVTISSPSANQILQYNGSAWINTSLSAATLPALSSANIWVGNGSNVAAAVAPSGDASISNAGVITNTGIQGTAVTVASLSANQVLQYNGSKWVNATLSATLPSLADAKIWVGNGSSVAMAVTPSGDVSLADTGALTVNKIQNSTVTISSPSANQVLQYNGSAWLNVTPSYQSSTLSSGNIWIGNGSNIATSVTPSGDASITSAGVITNTGIQGTAVTVASLSANQVLQYNGSKWVNATLSATLPSLSSGNIWVGNGGGVATAVSPTGDVSISNTGGMSTVGIQNTPVTISSLSTNQILQYNGSKWVNVTPTYQSSTLSSGNIWIGNGSNVATAVAPSGDASITSAGVITNTGIQGTAVTVASLSANQVLQYNGSKWVNATISTSPTGQALTAANIWVGNASNLAAPVTMSGDVTMTSAGATTLGKINGNAINVTSLSSGQVLQYNGSQWVNVASVGGSGTTNYVAKFSASGTVANSSITDDGTYVQVTKVLRGPASNNATTGTVDFSTGNTQYTTNSCGTFALWNLKDGATYTFVVQGTTAATCNFTGYSDAGSTSVTVHYPPNYGATTNSYATVFSFIVVGGNAYVAWVPGYQ